MTAVTECPALKMEKVTYSYGDTGQVLSDVTLSVSKGERVALIGPNGSGKTTLFLLAGGVMACDSGNIAVMGKEVVPGRFDPGIGLVFQNPDDQLFCPTVLEDLKFGLLNTGVPHDESGRRAMEHLRESGLSHLASRPPHHLSGGEKRMVSIAGVMVMAPSVILLDEPESSLDGRYRRGLINYLRKMTETLIVASHDLELLLEVCTRAILIDGGTVCADGPIREIMANEPLMNSHGMEKPHSLIPH